MKKTVSLVFWANRMRSVLIVLSCMFVGNLGAAAVRLALDFDTNVTFYLSNRSVKTFFVKRNTGGLFDSFVYDAFFADGPSVGINRLRWEGNDGLVYESILDLKPGDGVMALRITRQNTLIDPDPFAPYRNKIVYKVKR